MLPSHMSYRDEFLEAIVENPYYCIVTVDREGYITYLSKSYGQFLGVKPKDVVGKHVTEVIENTRMHIVVKTGKEEIADLQYIRGNYMIANRIPVFSDGKIAGAVGFVLYRDTKEWMEMNSHIKSLLAELNQYRKRQKKKYGIRYVLSDIIGHSREIENLKRKVKKIAPSDVSVLIRGESGTGKELFAQSIHHLSDRSQNPFVSINCAAIPEHLIESELFGYAEGAFTGAKKGGKPGKFQLADGGTLFLDEIGDMPLSAQSKLLRVLQYGEVQPVGSTKTQTIDVRIVAATNQPLETLIENKQFREDLFYRINVVQLSIPPLREREDDVRILAKYFLHHISERAGKRVFELDERVLALFLDYSWPGNVRELENVIESAIHLTSSEKITLEDLPDHFKPDMTQPKHVLSLKEEVEFAEKRAIKRALNQTNGDKIQAAAILGIGKSSLYEKMKKYKI
ncbi:transcriptional regulator [Melghiribacillus thermohalophilus]|uniref:Transcriptional regulator n=1 Tax=Melghiribacillus thermohalophilus TaxID=1324956 RepID=A0A4R3MW05_9BACI|nr:sigma 54-interacting transcriptional regulator [Melghiribacillus thermohalophilus]TCT19611.1 transcriptional regulator [Melghiribacillus thermohalophilus]